MTLSLNVRSSEMTLAGSRPSVVSAEADSNGSGLSNTSLYKDRGHLTLEHQVLISSAMAVIILFTVCGNLLTIISVRMEKKLRTVSNMYIASLAVADLIVGGLVMTFMLLYSVIFNGVWHFGPSVCHMWTLIDYVCCSASLTNVCIIAYDRYKTVAQPLKAIHRRTKRRALYLVIVAWSVPIVFWTSVLSILRALDEEYNPRFCDVIWKPPFMAFTSVVIMVYIPITVILILFIAMMKVLQEHMKSMNQRMKRAPSIKKDRQQSNRRTQSEETTSEVGGGISFNPRFEAEADKVTISIKQRRPPLISDTSTESCETWSTKSVASNDVLLKATEVKYISVGTNTCPGMSQALCRTIGTNTSPQFNKKTYKNPNLRNIPDVAEVEVEVVEGESANLSEDETTLQEMKEDEDAHSVVRDSRSTSVDSTFPWNRSWHRILRKQSSNMSCESKISRDSPNWRRYASVMRAERQNSLEKRRLKRQVRAAKTLGLIMAFLLLCWLPFAVMWPLKAFCPSCVSQRVFDISIWVNYLNSSVNPIIYCLCNPQFRKAFKRFLTRR